jgi:hypothetical protein
MARMMPSVIDPQRSPPGEVELFNLLSEHGPPTWIGLHSLDLPDHVRQIEGELDFLVLIPGVAAVCVEVKSHQRVVRDTNGLWRLGDREPTPHSPFRQASEAMYSARAKVRERQNLATVPFVSVVAFPRCRFDLPATEWAEYQVIDESDLQLHGIVGALTRAGTRHREKLNSTPAATWFRDDAGEPTVEQCEQIARILRPNFERSRSPKARRSEIQGEIRRYTEEQFGALDILDANARIVFTGGAGTGKTFLALEAARRANLQGARVLLVCYNRLLGAWMKREAAPLGELTDAGTLHSIMLRISGAAVPDNASHRFWSTELPTSSIEALLDGHPSAASYDVVVIDEAQDVCSPDYLDVLDLLVTGGLSDGKVLAFGDFEHQAIYTSSDARDLLAERMTFAAGTLRDNCRNRPRIGAIATSASGRELYRGYRRNDDGIEVLIRPYKTPADQTTILTTLIDTFREDGYQLGDIVILSPLGHQPAHESLTNPHTRWLAPADADTAPKIGTSTIHAFKGLEAAAVIVTDVTDLDNLHNRQLLYIAATRATDRLAFCVAQQAIPQLQSLIIGGTP